MVPTLFDSPATLSLMVITIGMSLLAFSNPGIWRYLALEPYRMAQTHQYHQIITSGLLHGDLGHLFMNMLTLYFFGPLLEETFNVLVGREMFLVVYLVSLVVGNLYPFIKFRNQHDYIAIGASGAISGILFSFCLFYPTERIYIFFSIPIPAILFAILYVAYSVYAMKRRSDNIGHEAHLAGAVGGLLTTIVLVPEALTTLGERL